MAEFIGEAFTVAVASAITYVAGKSAVDASKKLPAVEFDPAKSSGPLLMSSFGSSSFANIAETNGAKAQ